MITGQINGRATATAEDTAKLKFDILTLGLRISPEAEQVLFQSDRSPPAKRTTRTRSGVSGGLDICLENGVYVNAPIRETFARSSPFDLKPVDEQWGVFRDGMLISIVDITPEPQFYSKRTKDGEQLLRLVAQMCSPDRLCYGMTGSSCFFWEASRRCKYCSIGINRAEDPPRKRAEHFVETVEAALSDPICPARHILIGGGTPQGRDMGALLACQLTRDLKKRAQVPVYVMIVAPLENHYIDQLYDAGVDELGMNLEFWSDDAWGEYIPGKQAIVTKRRYLEALEYAVKLFGRIRTRSILIAGLEPARETIKGVEALASLGVMPILSPFRALDGTLLENRKSFSSVEYLDLFRRASAIVDTVGMPLGPTCICCQNNTLSLPFGSHYRKY